MMTDKNLYCGIDPSLTNTGVIILDGTGKIVHLLNSKTFKIKNSKLSHTQHLERIDDLTQKIVDSIQKKTKKDTATYVVYEDYSYDSINKPYTIGEYGGVLKTRLLKRFGNITVVKPTRIKKFATGYGAATKEDMINQACLESEYIRKLPDVKRTDDVCDAFFMAKYCWYATDPQSAVDNESYRDLIRSRLTMLLKK